MTRPLTTLASIFALVSAQGCRADARVGASGAGGTSASSGGGSASEGSASESGGSSAGEEAGGEASGEASGEAGEASSGATSASTSAGEGGLRLDVGAGEAGTSAGEGTPGVGCKKVDFLFVVDNSGSMEAEQQNLANSFPGFISAIQNNPNLRDFRVMVIDTDANGPTNVDMGVKCSAGAGGTSCTCLPDPTCCPKVCDQQGAAALCNGRPACDIPEPEPCDIVLGGGKTKSSTLQGCGVAGGRRYLEPTQPDLDQTFACLAQVGITGDGNEQQAGSMLTALGPEFQGPGGCNEGFLRDDAILVVTLITDEEDGPEVGGDTELLQDTNSPGNAASWKQALVDLKHGDENAIVMLGIVGDTGTAGQICTPFSGVNGAENCQQLRDFADSFVYGQWNSVCAPDYAPFFAAAVGEIESACDVFVPPG